MVAVSELVRDQIPKVPHPIQKDRLRRVVLRCIMFVKLENERNVS